MLTNSKYAGKPFAQCVQEALGERATVQVDTGSELHKFAVIPKRWVVERSFAWLELLTVTDNLLTTIYN